MRDVPTEPSLLARDLYGSGAQGFTLLLTAGVLKIPQQSYMTGNLLEVQDSVIAWVGGGLGVAGWVR